MEQAVTQLASGKKSDRKAAVKQLLSLPVSSFAALSRKKLVALLASVLAVLATDSAADFLHDALILAARVYFLVPDVSALNVLASALAALPYSSFSFNLLCKLLSFSVFNLSASSRTRLYRYLSKSPVSLLPLSLYVDFAQNSILPSCSSLLNTNNIHSSLLAISSLIDSCLSYKNKYYALLLLRNYFLITLAESTSHSNPIVPFPALSKFHDFATTPTSPTDFQKIFNTFTSEAILFTCKCDLYALLFLHYTKHQTTIMHPFTHKRQKLDLFEWSLTVPSNAGAISTTLAIPITTLFYQLEAICTRIHSITKTNKRSMFANNEIVSRTISKICEFLETNAKEITVLVETFSKIFVVPIAGLFKSYLEILPNGEEHERGGGGSRSGRSIPEIIISSATKLVPEFQTVLKILLQKFPRVMNRRGKDLLCKKIFNGTAANLVKFKRLIGVVGDVRYCVGEQVYGEFESVDWECGHGSNIEVGNSGVVCWVLVNKFVNVGWNEFEGCDGTEFMKGDWGQGWLERGYAENLVESVGEFWRVVYSADVHGLECLQFEFLKDASVKFDDFIGFPRIRETGTTAASVNVSVSRQVSEYVTTVVSKIHNLLKFTTPPQHFKPTTTVLKYLYFAEIGVQLVTIVVRKGCSVSEVVIRMVIELVECAVEKVCEYLRERSFEGDLSVYIYLIQFFMVVTRFFGVVFSGTDENSYRGLSMKVYDVMVGVVRTLTTQITMALTRKFNVHNPSSISFSESTQRTTTDDGKSSSSMSEGVEDEFAMARVASQGSHGSHVSSLSIETTNLLFSQMYFKNWVGSCLVGKGGDDELGGVRGCLKFAVGCLKSVDGCGSMEGSEGAVKVVMEVLESVFVSWEECGIFCMNVLLDVVEVYRDVMTKETILWIQQKTQKLLSSPKYENNPKLLSKIINVHYSLVPIYTTKMRTEVEICENFAIVVAYFMNRVEQGMQQIEFDDEEFTTTVKKEKRSGKGRGKGDIIELHWICVLEFVELLDEYLQNDPTQSYLLSKTTNPNLSAHFQTSQPMQHLLTLLHHKKIHVRLKTIKTMQSLVKFYKVGELWVDYVNNLCGGWFLFDFCGADADANRKGKNGKKEKGTKVEDSDDEVAVDQRKEGVDVDSEGWEMILSDCFAYYFMASFVPGVFVDCCVGVLNIFRGVSFDRRFGGGDDLVEIVKEDSGKRAVKSLDVDSDVEDVIEVDNDDGQVLATEARFLGVTVFEFVKRVFCSMFTKITGQEYDDAMYKRFYLEVLRQIVYRYAAENDKGGELGVERLIEGFPWRVFGIESKKEFLRVVEVDLWCGFMASKGGVDAEDFVEKNLESVVVNLLPKKHNQNLNIPQQQNLLRIANQKKFEKKFTSSILQIASKLLFTVGWINIPVSDLEVMAVLKEFFGFWSGAEPEFSCETGMKLDLDADQWVGVQWYDAESVLSSLSEIAQVGGFENIRGLFADQTLSILQTFHEKITTSLYNSTKFHYFQGYAFFIALNYKSLMHPFYFPYVYNFLSRSFNNKVLQSTALGVTRFLLLYLGSTRSDILLDYLIFITETLTSICTENTDPNSETDLLVKLQIKEILSELYSTVPEIKSNCVQSQIAFLQIPHEFRPDGFNQDAVSPNECIPIILDSLVSYQLEKKLGLIRVLKGILKVAGGVEENLRLLIFRAMKTLLYQLPSDSEEGIDVGFCMGYLIGVDEGNRCDENESKSSGHLHSLTQLSRYLLFEDVLVVGSIIELLYNVAATDIGLELISQLPHKVRSVLEIFTVNGKKEKSSAFKWTSTHAYLPVQNLSAWRLEDEETKSSGVADDIRVKKWVRNLVNSVLSSCATDEYYIHFGPVFEHLPAFAEAMIPYVFHSALLNEIKNAESEELPIRAKISENLTRFFTTTLEIPHFDEATARVVKILLSILEFLQTQSIPVTDAVPRTGQNQWLQVDYKLIASIATRVKNWNVALYFLELEYSSTLSAEGTTIEDETLKRDEMLFQIYKNLNDPDGFDGILEIYQPNIEAAMDSVLVQKFERDKEWLKLLDYHETHAQFEETAGNSAAVGAESHSLGILKSLNELKLYQVSCGFASSFGIIKLDENKNGDESKRSRASEVFYESCWRTGNFQKSLEFPGNDSITGFHQIICNSIKAINEQQTQTIPELINRGMSDSLLSLQNIHKSKFQESLIPIYILDEIQQCANVLHSDDRERDMSKMFSEWNNRLNTFDRSMSYSEVEMLLSVRTSLLRVIHNTVEDRFRQDSGLVEFFDGHLQRVCKLARKSGSYKEANDAFEILRQLHNGKVPLDGIIGRLKTIWSQGEQSTAIRTLKLVLKTDKEPVLLILLGRWISELRIENPITINETYFQKAIKQTVSEPNKLGKLYHHLAKFTDAIYKTMESDELNNMMQELIKVKLNEVEGLKVVMRAQPTGSDARQAWENQIKKLELQIDIDKSDAARFESDKKNFLNQSIENYLKALAYDSKSDMCVFPLTTLWFLNQDKYEDIHALIESYIPTISSYKFLTLVYQLSARMGAIQLPDGSISLFQRALYRLIYKMTSDHPHHTLPQILALQNGDISHSSDSKNRRQSNPNKPTTLSARAAQFLTSQLKTKVPKLEPVILQMDLLFDAYIEFAMWKPISKDSRALSPKDGVYVLDKRFKLAALGELDHVPVISFDHPVRPNTQYDDLPYIKKFDTTYKLIGGINLPKVVQCIDSTGKAHKQLVKGSDDLRQDAVLLKIFSLVNDLLKQNPETRRRNLKIRTYRVVPLSPRAGVLEWVENTVTLGNYLSDSHQKYNKNDLSPSECRKKMNREHQNNFSSIESKLAVFGKICNNFRPVFRHFFFENFKDPVEWFERRQTYVRSLACSSITGYVVGLGDRHAQNILFDERTAEIVHIDFGICFDVGRLLSTPEIVPFRLTRDLVDGMGITGVEGAFRNSCEETLQLLRSESSILLAILDVFRFDPLYIWKVTQQRTQQAQRKVQQTLMMTDDKEAKVEPTTSKTENSNNEAERALLGVRKKLEVNVSVKCQVNELIQMAQDERNLCRMFPGWQPWL